MKIAVVGAHLSGQPLNSQLTQRDGRLVRSAKTLNVYRLYALAQTTPPKPGLIRAHEPTGVEIEMEIWELGPKEFASFVDLIPAPLCIGTIEMSDGETVKGFLVEAYAVAAGSGAKEITQFGGWRKYLQALGS